MPLPGDQATPGQDFLTARLADLDRQLRELAAARSPSGPVMIPMYAKCWPSTFLDSADTDLTIPASNATDTMWESYLPQITRTQLWLAMICGRVTGTSGTPTYTVQLNRDTSSPVTVGSWTQTGYYRTTQGPFDISTYLGQPAQLTVAISATGTGTDRVAAQLRQCWMQ